MNPGSSLIWRGSAGDCGPGWGTGAEAGSGRQWASAAVSGGFWLGFGQCRRGSASAWCVVCGMPPGTLPP